MKRLGWLGRALFAAFGVVVAAALFPASNWSFRNQLDFLAAPHEWTVHAWDVQPLRTGVPWNPANRVESLNHAYTLRYRHSGEPLGPNDSYLDRPWLKAFADHEKRFPNDVEAWAGHGRLLCSMPMYKPANEIDPTVKARMSATDIERQVKRRREGAQSLLDVATRGAAIEPENLYFHLLRVMALSVLGRDEEARRELLQAAELRRYEDYSISEAAVTIRAVEGRLGYRGEAFRTSVLAAILLPHFASVKGSVREMIARCPAEELVELRWALFRTNATLARESSTFIGVLVGRAGMAMSLAGTKEFRSTAKDTPEIERERKAFLVSQAKSLTAALDRAHLRKGGEDPARMFDEVERLVAIGKKTIDSGQDPLFDRLYFWTIGAARCLLGFLALLAALPGLRFWARRSPEAFNRSRGAMAMAFALMGTAVWTSADSGAGVLLPLIGALLMLAMAWLLAKERSIRPLAIALPAVAVLVTLDSTADAVVLVAGIALAGVGAVWLASRWSWAASLLAFVAAAIVGVLSFSHAGYSLGILLVVSLTLLAGCLLSIAPPKRFDLGAAVIALAVAVGYASMVARDVADNARLRVFNPRFVSEAARIRQEAGLPRLSHEIEDPLPN